MDTGGTITCPKCGNRLPGWAQICQFCKADVRAVARPAPERKKQYHFASLEPPKWVFPAYFSILGLWILLGAISILSMVVKNDYHVVELLSSALTIVVSICAIFRLEFARGIINWVSGWKLFWGVLRLLGGLILTLGMPALGFIVIALAIFDIVTAAFMIFLLGETDKYAPS